MKIANEGETRDRTTQEFALYAKLEIDPGEYRTMPSDCLIQALEKSFVRLTEALTGEFEVLLGDDFRLISVQRLDVHGHGRQVSTVVRLTVESATDIVNSLSSYWLVSAGNWVHTMALSFPELRGSTSVSIRHEIQSSSLAEEEPQKQAA